MAVADGRQNLVSSQIFHLTKSRTQISPESSFDDFRKYDDIPQLILRKPFHAFNKMFILAIARNVFYRNFAGISTQPGFFESLTLYAIEY